MDKKGSLLDNEKPAKLEQETIGWRLLQYLKPNIYPNTGNWINQPQKFALPKFDKK